MPGGSTVQSALVSTLNDCVARIVDAVDLAEIGSPYVSLRADESSIAAGAGPPPRLGAVRVWVNSHADGFEKLPENLLDLGFGDMYIWIKKINRC